MNNKFNTALYFIIVLGFLAMAFSLYETFTSVSKTHTLLTENVQIRQEKRTHLISMYNAARERSITLLEMLDIKDAFELDDYNLLLSSHATNFINARVALMKLGHSPQEELQLNQLYTLSSTNSLRQRQVVDFLIDEEAKSAKQLLFNETLPAQAHLLKKMDSIIAEQTKALKNSLGMLNQNLLTSLKGLGYSSSTFFLLSIFTVFILISRASRREARILIESLDKEKIISKDMTHHATHDQLTSIRNRRYFEETLLQLKQQTKSHNTQHVLLYIDLDQFKIVNDTAGHDAGDDLIKEVTNILKTCVRNTDTLARLGGDEFGVLLPNCTLNDALTISESIRSKLENFQFVWHEASFYIGGSIGVAILNHNTINENILSLADIACYNAKESGRNCVHVYEKSDHQVLKREVDMQTISTINKALESQRIHLYTQPIAPIDSTSELHQYHEVLTRLADEDGNIISPDIFISAAERYGIMPKLDNYIINQAFNWLTKQSTKDIKLSINLSGASLSSSEFIKNFNTHFSHFELAHNVCFEITETTALRNFSETITFFKSLKESGYSIALDDFGSGLASFEYLKNLPIDIVKIDGAFVKHIETSDIDITMIKAIVEVSKKMGLKTVAEYVENKKILSILKKLGVDYAQGYEIAKPFPITQLK